MPGPKPKAAGLGGLGGLAGPEVIEKTNFKIPGMGLLKPPFPTKLLPKDKAPSLPALGPAG